MEEKKIDVSKNIRDLNYNLLDAIADVTNKSTLKDFYRFLIRNIVYKLRDFCDLYTRSAIESANIILRAAFEEIVVFEYLLNKPEYIEKYKSDSEIEEFKLSFEMFLDGFVSKEELSSKYQELSEYSKNSIEIFWNKPINLKDKRSKEEQKVLAQKTRYLLDELIKMDSTSAIRLKGMKTVYYSNPCGYVHSTFSKIIMKKILLAPQSLSCILTYSIFSLDLSEILMSNIEIYCDHKESINKFRAAFINFHDFMEYVKTTKDKSIVKGD